MQFIDCDLPVDRLYHAVLSVGMYIAIAIANYMQFMDCNLSDNDHRTTPKNYSSIGVANVETPAAATLPPRALRTRRRRYTVN